MLRLPSRFVAPAALLLGMTASCGDESPAAPTASGTRPAPAATPLPSPQDPSIPPVDPEVARLAYGDGVLTPRDVAPIPGEKFTWRRDALAGWTHVSSTSGEYRLPEITCGGVALADFDGDGDLDVFLVNGGVWPDQSPGAPFPGHALFRNDGALRFTNVALESGVYGDRGDYGMGAAAADVDGDGDQDLYVTGLWRNRLYLNDGKGRFREEGERAGVAGGKWASSAAFFDADRDGRLDLYVANYVEFSIEVNRANPCGVDVTGFRDYCSPKEYLGVADAFYRNEGPGPDGVVRFRECLVERGLKGSGPLTDHDKGLGVIASDVDDDGDADLYVANDGCPNFLFLNDGSGRFEECAVMHGAAYGESGGALASMGIDAGDIDGDGDFDLLCANLDFEINSLYVNDGRGWFADEARMRRLAAADRGSVGFGLDFFDQDHDGDLDLLIANGHVLVNVHRSRGTVWYLQADQLFENDGKGRFALVPTEKAGAWFDVRKAGRGLATGDLDGDGDLDAVVIARDEPAALLENNHVPAGQRGDAFLFTLRGNDGNVDAVGAKVSLTIGGKTLIEEVRAGNSYCSRSDLRVHFGSAGAKQSEKLEVRWPNGEKQTFGSLEAGFEYRVTQGRADAEKVRELIRK